MPTPTILSKAQASIFVDISQTLDEATFERFVRDAQNTDLSPLLGYTFYSHVVNNLLDPAVNALVVGGEYQYNDNDYYNPGLREVLTHYSYARYLMGGQTKDTPFSTVKKTTPYSEPIEVSQLKEMVKIHRQTGRELYGQVEFFLRVHKSDYPLWNQDCEETGGSSSSFRVTRLTRNTNYPKNYY